ncbi:hypothetical protein HPB52_012626 [Rhipicephalus sanguineus]|uniref:Alpha-aspartyl dipeptidase n=1 Tax=Rhipicephalus sanguineus TaxID=34632 RepID=A0A9D4Q6V9_RHISA|nr:hypothetical protein HPB52_012626 [Rhipicephalus sanguineus]
MAAPRRLLLLSNSTMYNGEFLEFAADTVKDFFKKSATKRILFVPYARKDYADYAAKVKARLGEMGFEVDSIHEAADPVSAVKMAQGIFIGGGNTFRLLKTLYESNTAEAIRIRCLEDGMPYMGASAGTNVATANICTTNDMPIFYPPTFVALRLVPFNINPHYIETDPDSKHMEGAILKVEGNHAVLLGNEAKLFKENVDPVYYKPGADMSFLLTDTNA